MVFAYYNRLSAAGKRVYQKSDAIALIKIPNASKLHPLTSAIKSALDQEDHAKTKSSVSFSPIP